MRLNGKYDLAGKPEKWQLQPSNYVVIVGYGVLSETINEVPRHGAWRATSAFIQADGSSKLATFEYVAHKLRVMKRSYNHGAAIKENNPRRRAQRRSAIGPNMCP